MKKVLIIIMLSVAVNLYGAASGGEVPGYREAENTIYRLNKKKMEGTALTAEESQELSDAHRFVSKHLSKMRQTWVRGGPPGARPPR